MKKSRSNSFRPNIERLEDRRVPALIIVTTTADVVNPHDGLISLREAITLANATAAPDTIQLKGGVYAISLAGAGDNANVTGDFDITNPLTINGQGPKLTFVDGAHLDRLFDVTGAFNVTFANITLRNGSANGNGGAIQAAQANLTLNNCAVTGNAAVQGGAIDADAGTVTLNNCTLTNNSATGNGGGIFAGLGNITLNRTTVSGGQAGDGGGLFAQSGSVTLIGSTLTNNRGLNNNGGGIVATHGDVAITDSTLAGNTAFNGGGLFAEFGNVTLLRSTVHHNSAFENGGGMDVANGTLSLKDSAVRLNVAGQTGDGATGGFGGGMFARFATLTNSTVSGNTAFTSGGGLYAADSATLTGGTVSGNTAHSEGGGMYVFNVARLTSTTVSGNTAFSAAGFGGGVVTTSAFLTACTVSGNFAGNGAGVAATAAFLTNSTISGNVAAGVAGGVFSHTTAALTGCTVSANTAGGAGGGIDAATATLTNCTVSGNSAGVASGSGGSLIGGGGILASAGTILNCTIVENFATGIGGGLLATRGANPIHVKNTIIADNLALALSSGPDVSGTIASDGHNLVGAADGSTGFGAAGDQLGSVRVPLDPRLGPLQNNGGITFTQALLPDSSAIDRGDNTGVPVTDQRGVARRRDGDGNGSRIVDIGAFEV